VPGDWWAAKGQAAGTTGHDYYAPTDEDYIVDNAWGPYVQFHATENNWLWMGILEANAKGGSGTWNYLVDPQLFAPNLPAGLPYENSGTWTAFAVVTPIPAAVWLFGSGLGALGVFRRKMKVKAYPT
jgi:hypothetical protein